MLLNQLYLQQRLSHFHLIFKASSPSTHEEAKNLIKQHMSAPTIILAETQTVGHGTHDRAFFSPPETGLYFSYLRDWSWPAQQIGLLTPLVAVAAQQVLKQVTQQPIQIKWVNDLYLHRKKIAGILCTSQVIPEKNPQIIISMGLNVFPAASLPPALLPKVGALTNNQQNNADLREALLYEIIKTIDHLITHFNPDTLIKTYQANQFLRHEWVSFLVGSTKQTAQIIGIDQQGGLILQTKNGTPKTYYSGEITNFNWQDC